MNNEEINKEKAKYIIANKKSEGIIDFKEYNLLSNRFYAEKSVSIYFAKVETLIANCKNEAQLEELSEELSVKIDFWDNLEEFEKAIMLKAGYFIGEINYAFFDVKNPIHKLAFYTINNLYIQRLKIHRGKGEGRIILQRESSLDLCLLFPTVHLAILDKIKSNIAFINKNKHNIETEVKIGESEVIFL